MVSACFSNVSVCVSDAVCYLRGAVLLVRLLLGVTVWFYYCFRLVFQTLFVKYGRPSYL